LYTTQDDQEDQLCLIDTSFHTNFKSNGNETDKQVIKLVDHAVIPTPKNVIEESANSHTTIDDHDSRRNTQLINTFDNTAKVGFSFNIKES
jgi:hypothetical protein